MAVSLNKVMIIGNVGRDPEMRYTADGKANARFSVAVSRAWTNQEGERKEETEWFNIVAWDKLAEICGEYVKKGLKIYVEGRLQTRTWDSQDGVKHKITELIARDVVFMGSRAKSTSPEEEGVTPPPAGGDIDPQDLPF